MNRDNIRARFGITAITVLWAIALCSVYPDRAVASEDDYAQSVMQDKPVGYWRFEEAAGSSAAINSASENGSANGRYEMVTLGHPSVSPLLGSAAEFKGSSAGSHIDLGSAKELMIRGDLTIEWWQYVTNTQVEDQSIICWGTPGETSSDNVLYEMVLRYSDSQKQSKAPRPQFVLGHEYDNGTNVRLTSDLRSHFNRWYHVVAVRDANKRTVQYYINGRPSGVPISYADNDENPQGGDSGGAAIGKLGRFDKRYFQGLLDEVAVYDHTLSADRIKEHYQIALKGMDMSHRPLVVAHRGNNRFAPENTSVSYQQAIEAKAPIVELDLQHSKDGVVILMHDKTLERTTNGSGPVNEKTLAELKKLDAGSWKDARYTGEPIPTFAELAELCKGQTVMMLDLKTLVRGEEISAVLNQTGYPEDQIIVAPWQIEHASAIKPYLPDASMILLHSKLPSMYTGDGAFFEEMKQMGFSGFSLNWVHLDKRFVKQAQDHGMRVYTWTLNDPSDISGAVLMNVDGIITDDPKVTAEMIKDIAD